MACRECGADLERPGDYCLVCRSRNADVVVLDVEPDRAEIACLDEEEVVARRVVTTTPEDPESELARTERRNFAGLVADDVRRKRPEAVYATGDRDLVRAITDQLRYECYRIDDPDPVSAVLETRGEDPLAVVDGSVADKLGGSHSTVIGDRAGERVLAVVADHPNVKKIVPGPIDAGGAGSRSGVRAKVTRVGPTGNLRLLVRDGSSVQTVHVVTTAGDRSAGEPVRADLNEALRAADLAA